MKLSGQAAVITGASSGIGKAIAIALAAEGAGVALVGRQIDLLEQTAQATGRNTRIYATELTDDTALEQLAYDLRYDWQTINILIHCAGVIASGRVEQAPVAEFDRQYRINVRAPYLLTQVLLPSLRECNGQIVFINSTAGLHQACTAGACREPARGAESRNTGAECLPWAYCQPNAGSRVRIRGPRISARAPHSTGRYCRACGACTHTAT